jgi:MFS family permease
VVAVGVVFTMARFSEAFLVLRAQGVGLPVALVPVVLIVMNVVYAATSAPLGRISDHMDRRVLLAAGLGVLALADAALAWLGSVAGVLLGAALWGLHMGVTQGLFAALVADAAPQRLRGTAFGVFNFATGITLLLASVLAGGLWSAYGPGATFLAGGVFALVALVGLGVVSSRPGRDSLP